MQFAPGCLPLINPTSEPRHACREQRDVPRKVLALLRRQRLPLTELRENGDGAVIYQGQELFNSGIFCGAPANRVVVRNRRYILGYVTAELACDPIKDPYTPVPAKACLVRLWNVVMKFWLHQ